MRLKRLGLGEVLLNSLGRAKWTGYEYEVASANYPKRVNSGRQCADDYQVLPRHLIVEP